MSVDLSKATLNISSLWSVVIGLAVVVGWLVNNLAWSSDIQRLEQKIEDSDKRNSIRYFLRQRRQLELLKILSPEEDGASDIQTEIEQIDGKILCLRTAGCELVDDV